MGFRRELSWDEEQVAKYGLAAHMGMTTAPFRRQAARINTKLVEENIDQVLALLSDTSEETRTRAVFAIPGLIIATGMPSNLVRHNWREIHAGQIYEDWFERSSCVGPMVPFNLLAAEEQEPFHKIVEAIISSQNTEVPAA